MRALTVMGMMPAGSKAAAASGDLSSCPGTPNSSAVRMPSFRSASTCLRVAWMPLRLMPGRLRDFGRALPGLDEVALDQVPGQKVGLGGQVADGGGRPEAAGSDQHGTPHRLEEQPPQGGGFGLAPAIHRIP